MYIQAVERIPMVGGDDGAQGFPLSAYCCVPMELKALVLSKNYNFCVNRVGTCVEGNVRKYSGWEKRNRSE
jgi:hypothetical protein